MADSVAAISCQIVYADPEGEVHLQLPIFIDAEGACHVSLGADEDSLDREEAGRVLSHICLGSSSPASDARRASLQRTLERAISEDCSPPGSAHRLWLQGTLKRLSSFNSGSTEEKDALRRAVLSERERAAHAQTHPEPVEEAVPTMGMPPPAPEELSGHRYRSCFLSYTEQRQLLSSH